MALGAKGCRCVQNSWSQERIKGSVALEDTYVLVADTGKHYLLPNLKASLLSRYLGKTVRVHGVAALVGDAIIVETAEALVDGKWKAFSSSEIMDQAEKLIGSPYKF